MNIMKEISRLEGEIRDKKARLANLRKKLSLEKSPVQNYQFTCSDKSTKTLEQLFKDKDELFIIHNMGRGCAYCTMWADGFNGLIDHIESRTAMAVATPDDPVDQAEFAKNRNWKFTMISTKGTNFTEDMGFSSENNLSPGISIFQKSEDGTIYKVNQTAFCPYDDYNPVWHLFALLPTKKEWSPKLNY